MPTLSTGERVHVTKIVDRRTPAADVVVLGVRAPQLARFAKPGQFVMVVPPAGEVASVALGIYEAQGDRMSVLFFVSGKRTTELARLQEGDELTITGPLGNGFFLDDAPSEVGIVAGGVGVASVLTSAQELLKNGCRVQLYYGARTQERLVDMDLFARAGCEVHAATDDGSFGYRGVVTDLLARAARPPRLLLACGPSPMLRAVARVAAEIDIPAQLSLEETFACGVGGCWGCVVPIVRTSAQAPSFPPAVLGGSDVVNARVCKEGPVFWAHELRW